VLKGIFGLLLGQLALGSTLISLGKDTITISVDFLSISSWFNGDVLNTLTVRKVVGVAGTRLV
jgi:hypothetical protein